uniref:Carbonic anhydrase n=1 Tax=Cynoglossus semilaevis TaxID=244447 RepID=A0A3P8WSZ9_CYNSE
MLLNRTKDGEHSEPDPLNGTPADHFGVGGASSNVSKTLEIKVEAPHVFRTPEKMEFLVAALITVCVLVSRTDGGETSAGDATWPYTATKYCAGKRQSPINIDSSAAEADCSLTAFSFVNFDNKFSLKSITNTGRTVKVGFYRGVKISGGGLSEEYDSLQFHLHWGNGFAVPGSEHTVDRKRYPMELHIVSMKSSYNGNISLAVADSTGLAVLGFFIDVRASGPASEPASWTKLTSYLSKIPTKGDMAGIAPGISLDELLEGVDRTKYYRYLGSLTTPMCNEAVVWTVFKEPIQISRELVSFFLFFWELNSDLCCITKRGTLH